MLEIGIPDWKENRKSGIPGIPKWKENRKSGNPGIPGIPEIWKSGIPGIPPGNLEFRLEMKYFTFLYCKYQLGETLPTSGICWALLLRSFSSVPCLWRRTAYWFFASWIKVIWSPIYFFRSVILVFAASIFDLTPAISNSRLLIDCRVMLENTCL